MKGRLLSQKSNELWLFDSSVRASEPGLLLVGVDEAGRGPLAGPVFAAAVCFDEDTRLDCIFDSKRMSERQREHAYSIIVDEALHFAVASATAEEINSLNIRQASLLAMRRAVTMLGAGPSVVIVDGRDELGHNLNSRALVGGDGKSLCVAAASILAKVTRDEYMRQLDEELPGYGFAKHKGYPTSQHYDAISKLGPCKEHRLSYNGVLKGGSLKNNYYGGK